MKYVCLGYLSEKDWQQVEAGNRNAIVDECFKYDEWLMDNGYHVGGIALQSTANATTLRLQNGKVAVLDGPYTETKEQLGGILIIEANDLNHAIQLMSKHPGTQMGGCWEIRPAADLTEMMLESKDRRKEDA